MSISSGELDARIAPPKKHSWNHWMSIYSANKHSKKY